MRSEFREGWGTLLASTLGIGLGLSPVPIYTLGIIAPELTHAFGWSTAQVMFVVTITTLVIIVMAPLVGALSTRIGTRPVAIVSVALFGLGIAALSLSGGSLPLFYASWAVIAVFGAGTLPIIWTRAVNNRFERRKGLALGIAMMGTGLFGIFAKPYVNWLVDAHGWRGAFVGLGLLPLLIALPAALLLFHDAPAADPLQAQAAGQSGMTLGQAVRGRRFWLLVVILVPVSFALGGPVPNMEGMLRLGGLDHAAIVRLTPLIGLSAILGRLAGGWLLDRFWAPAVGAVLLALPAISCFILSAHAVDPGAAMLAIFLIGFALGIEYDLIAFIVARYFGMRGYGPIYGWLYVCFGIGSGFAAPIFGWDLDRHGSFAMTLSISAAFLLAGGAALLLLGRYPAAWPGRVPSPELSTAPE